MQLAWSAEDEAFRAELIDFLDAHTPPELRGGYDFQDVHDEHELVPQWLRDWQATLFDHGWMIPGYPPDLGGRNCTPVQTLIYLETLASRRLLRSGHFPGYAIVAPSLLEYGNDEQKQLVAAAIRGDTIWCIGMSEPNAGSDLAGLQTRADVYEDHFVINGQKVWTSIAQYSDRCVLLTRTGEPGSRHRGITAFFVDMDTPGVTVSPLEMINGEHEFAEVFFDDVVVPADRMLGELNGGWAVAMSILPYERSSCFWQRIAHLYHRLQVLVDDAGDDDSTAQVIGDAFLQLHAARARSRRTQHRLGAGETVGAETSIDKVLIGAAEQTLYEAVRRLRTGVVELDDSPAGQRWREEYLYSRAATIYGGTGEVQRNIIARRLLDLGSEG